MGFLKRIVSLGPGKAGPGKTPRGAVTFTPRASSRAEQPDEEPDEELDVGHSTPTYRLPCSAPAELCSLCTTSRLLTRAAGTGERSLVEVPDPASYVRLDLFGCRLEVRKLAKRACDVAAH